jgi:hypothetical protein
MGGEGSGRPPVDVDMEAVLDLLSRGEKPPAIADIFGISAVTLRKRIADLQQKQGLLLQYRVIQSLQLTELQARVLEAITPEKINSAPLRDLVMSYKILKDKELNIEGKPSEIKGLVAHLIYMEKQEAALKSGTPAPETFTDAQYDETNTEDENGECKDLALLDDQDF